MKEEAQHRLMVTDVVCPADKAGRGIIPKWHSVNRAGSEITPGKHLSHTAGAGLSSAAWEHSERIGRSWEDSVRQEIKRDPNRSQLAQPVPPLTHRLSEVFLAICS